MSRIVTLLLALPLIINVAACAGGTQSYPSLDIRDFERDSGAFEAPVEADALPAALTDQQINRLAQLTSQAAAAHQSFMEAAPITRRLVNRASQAPAASMLWGDAEIALADLDSKRSLTAIALADLDLLYAAEAEALNIRPEINAARAAIIQMLRTEDAILDALREQR